MKFNCLLLIKYVAVFCLFGENERVFGIYNPMDVTTKPSYIKTVWRKKALNPDTYTEEPKILMHHNYSRVFVHKSAPNYVQTQENVQKIEQKQETNFQFDQTSYTTPINSHEFKEEPSYEQEPDYQYNSKFDQNPTNFDIKPTNNRNFEQEPNYYQSNSKINQNRTTTKNFEREPKSEREPNYQYNSKFDQNPTNFDLKPTNNRNFEREPNYQSNSRFDQNFNSKPINNQRLSKSEREPNFEQEPNHQSNSRSFEREPNYDQKVAASEISEDYEFLNEIYGSKYKEPKTFANMAFEICPKNATGQLVYMWSCSQFLNCYKGRTHILNCSPGTKFNPETLECDYTHKVNCITGPRNQKVQFEKYIVGGNNFKTNELCKFGAAGLHQHPTDCTKFINCANGQTFVQSCGPGTAFNPSIMSCDYPEKVGCFVKQPDPNFPYTTTTEKDPYTLTHADIRSMPVNNPTVQKKENLIQLNTQTAEHNRPKCPSGYTGLFPHPYICSKFLNCAHGTTHIQDCGAGTVFNPDSKVCDWPRNVNCQNLRAPDYLVQGSGNWNTVQSTTSRNYVGVIGYRRPNYYDNSQGSGSNPCSGSNTNNCRQPWNDRNQFSGSGSHSSHCVGSHCPNINTQMNWNDYSPTGTSTTPGTIIIHGPMSPNFDNVRPNCPGPDCPTNYPTFVMGSPDKPNNFGHGTSNNRGGTICTGTNCHYPQNTNYNTNSGNECTGTGCQYPQRGSPQSGGVSQTNAGSGGTYCTGTNCQYPQSGLGSGGSYCSGTNCQYPQRGLPQSGGGYQQNVGSGGTFCTGPNCHYPQSNLGSRGTICTGNNCQYPNRGTPQSNTGPGGTFCRGANCHYPQSGTPQPNLDTGGTVCTGTNCKYPQHPYNANIQPNTGSGGVSCTGTNCQYPQSGSNYKPTVGSDGTICTGTNCQYPSRENPKHNIGYGGTSCTGTNCQYPGFNYQSNVGSGDTICTGTNCHYPSRGTPQPNTGPGGTSCTGSNCQYPQSGSSYQPSIGSGGTVCTGTNCQYPFRGTPQPNTGSGGTSCTGSNCQYPQSESSYQPSVGSGGIVCTGTNCQYPSRGIPQPSIGSGGIVCTGSNCQYPSRGTPQPNTGSGGTSCTGSNCQYPQSGSNYQPSISSGGAVCTGTNCQYPSRGTPQPNTGSSGTSCIGINCHFSNTNSQTNQQRPSAGTSCPAGTQCHNFDSVQTNYANVQTHENSKDYNQDSGDQQVLGSANYPSRNLNKNESKIIYIKPLPMGHTIHRPHIVPPNLEIPQPIDVTSSINKDKSKPNTNFLSTDLNADYDFEETTTQPSNKKQDVNRKVWKKNNRQCNNENEFFCQTNECVPIGWVCDGNLDCTNGLDEDNCIFNIKQFKKTPNTRLYKYEVEKWLNTDLENCANYCLNSESFLCKSFNYRKDQQICLLCNTNLGESGSLSKSNLYDYYELTKYSVDCNGKYECSNKKCINFTQVCDGNDDCGTRQDEKSCLAQALGYEIRLAGSQARHEGRIEVKVFDEWGYICDDNFSVQNADVVCKELGFKRGALDIKKGSYFAKDIHEEKTFYLMDDVRCVGNETSIRDCDFSGWGTHNCMAQEIVGVICKTGEEICPENHWKCDTTSECLPLQFLCDGVFDCTDHSDEGVQHCEAPIELRLINGSNKLEGRVEVRYHGVWGTICDDDFNDLTAKVICNSLGYKGSAVAKKDGVFGPGRGPIWLDQVHCFGNESSLGECSHWNWGEHNCEHNEDAGVVCSNLDMSEFEKKSRDKQLINIPSPKVPTIEQTYKGKCGYTGEDIFHEEQTEDSEIHFRVVQGSVAKKGQYPWQATIRVKGSLKSSHWCGGVIISNKHVLTAAHCLVGFSKGAYVIRAGEYDVQVDEGTETEAYIEDFFVHERFRQGGAMNNDIALIKLKGSGLLLSKYVQPICLPDSSTVYKSGLNCTISGFGSTETGKSASSNILRAGWITLQSDETCKRPEVYGDAITGGMFCAGSLESGVDTCDGDSGGPLACLDKGVFTLYGITSWGQRCGHINKPGVYVRVSHYRDWIDRKIEENQ